MALIRSIDEVNRFIRGNNQIWSLLYYDELLCRRSYDLSYVAQADAAFYNCAHVVEDCDDETAMEVEQQFAARGTDPAFYLDPDLHPKSHQVLIERGYRELPEETENLWAFAIDDQMAGLNVEDHLKIPSSLLEIVEVVDLCSDDFTAFLAIDQSANGLSDVMVGKLGRNLQQKRTDGLGVRILLGKVNGTPCATGTVGICDGVAYLAEGAVLPEFRRLGLHSAMLVARILWARKQGADYAVFTAVESAFSNRSAVRVGFELVARRVFLQKALAWATPSATHDAASKATFNNWS